ncbi:hypothetical protein GLW08_08190 [Pontibacillus yanchengensis]|uniref:Uncharacterized protein n=1 Tax=Pontibacillus yanchengensis TaxID=462910 RepID=A0ACC7VF44_9BACI|nr:hypothetical protein [Pontibacillus yanchengensis]MYL53317.1 hypothetical protein [Pontibacillus yanchengensis]
MEQTKKARISEIIDEISALEKPLHELSTGQRTIPETKRELDILYNAGKDLRAFDEKEVSLLGQKTIEFHSTLKQFRLAIHKYKPKHKKVRKQSQRLLDVAKQVGEIEQRVLKIIETEEV